jgi:predicted nucleotidyltransferase
MLRKATVFRLDPATQSALAYLSKLLARPMNKLVNEAVRDYLLKVSPKEREVEGTLSNLRAYRERDLRVAEPPAAYSNLGAGAEAGSEDTIRGVLRREKADSEIISASREFVRQVATRYSVKAAILFGSRARGTHRADSDVDIAVVLRGPRGKLMDTSIEMADIAFDVLLETTIYIQPLPIWEDEWEHPETYSNPRLLENIRREGSPI